MDNFQDNKADLVINYYVDDILERVMNILGIDIPPYNDADNLTKLAENIIIDWTIQRKDVLAIEKLFKAKCKGVKKKRSLIKNKRNSLDKSANDDDKSKVIKLEIKEENMNEQIESDEDNIHGTSIAKNNATSGNGSKTSNVFTNGDTQTNISNGESSVTDLCISGEV